MRIAHTGRVRWRGVSTSLLTFALAGCPGPTSLPPDDAGGSADVRITDAPPNDAGSHDAGSLDAPAPSDAPNPCLDPDRDGDGVDRPECGGTDCDDDEPRSAPGNLELCDADDVDEDCDPSTYGSRDLDADGHVDAACCNGPTCGDDCDDVRPDVFGGTTETCDDVDNDCDAAIDEMVTVTVFTDGDGDGYGVGVGMAACAGASGTAPLGGDCDDANVGISPGATELCADGIDNDCDSAIDESGPRSFFRDADGDGYGDPGDTLMSTVCEPPTGYASNSRDCDDARAASFPGNPVEPCNGYDDDCSLGLPGGGRDAGEDLDMDLHAGVGAACVGGTFPRDDCQDSVPTIFAGAPELCDGRDNDCSSGGLADTSEDADGDTHAPASATCSGGYPRNDCNDANATIHGGAIELCDRLDNDCSSGGGAEVSEDADDDGHAPPTLACAGGPRPEDDCRDDDATRYAGAAEICDRQDQDCSAGGGAEPSEDADDDGFAPLGATCSGGARPRTDCDDASATSHPGALELCGGGDTDCDGAADPVDPDAAATCGARAVCDSAGTCRVERPVTTAATLGGSSGVSAVLRGTGALYTWGYSQGGRLGTGTAEVDPRVRPVAVASVLDALGVTHGGEHGCVWRASGPVRCWGSAASLVLGSTALAPVDIAGTAGAIEVAAMEAATCARFQDGTVRCWGQDALGQLGNGASSTTPQAAPVLVSGLTDASNLEAGGSRACAVRRTGEVVCWGAGAAAPVAVAGLSTAIEVSVGRTNACVLRTDGTVVCWGDGGQGQLGDGTTSMMRPSPTNAVSGLVDATAIVVGGEHACALRATGGVVCWGRNQRNQLGDGSGASRSTTPVAVAGLVDAVALGGGGDHTCALRATGAVVCWGAHDAGELGDGTTTGAVPFPVAVDGLADAVELTASADHVCARRATGAVVCWGAPLLGDGTSSTSVTPVTVSGLGDASALGGSDAVTCAARSGGSVECWGSGPLGTGAASALSPVAVSGLSGVVALSSGDVGLLGAHVCALGASGISCWGDGDGGQLGNGVTASSATPVSTVFSLPDATVLTTGARHTCAARSSGVVSCWGALAELGSGTTSSLTPVAAVGITDGVEVAAGLVHTCARGADGRVWCWGFNGDGQIGDGTTTTRALPTLTGITDAAGIDCGDQLSCAVRTGGTVSCWGINRGGQVGIGTLTADVRTPASVLGLTDALEVVTTGWTTCARRVGGGVSCWGSRSSIGTALYGTAPRTPVTVVDLP